VILADTSAWVEFDHGYGVPLRALDPDVDLDRVCGVIGVPLDPASLRAG
jgi:hypothetical protein